MKNKVKRYIVPVLLTIGAIAVTTVVYVFTDNSVSSGISFLCSVLSILLSIIALWDTYKSGINIDAQFVKLENLIKEMRIVQHELDQSISNISDDNLPPSLKNKLDEFRNNLDSEDFLHY